MGSWLPVFSAPLWGWCACLQRLSLPRALACCPHSQSMCLHNMILEAAHISPPRMDESALPELRWAHRSSFSSPRGQKWGHCSVGKMAVTGEETGWERSMAPKDTATNKSCRWELRELCFVVFWDAVFLYSQDSLSFKPLASALQVLVPAWGTTLGLGLDFTYKTAILNQQEYEGSFLAAAASASQVLFPSLVYWIVPATLLPRNAALFGTCRGI